MQIETLALSTSLTAGGVLTLEVANDQPPTWSGVDPDISSVAQATAMLTRTQSPKGRPTLSKLRMTLSVPFLEPSTAASGTTGVATPKVAFVLKADTTVFLPTRSTRTERRAFAEALSSLFTADMIMAAIEDDRLPY